MGGGGIREPVEVDPFADVKDDELGVVGKLN